MKHPNSLTDPDCTNPDALREALDIRIAAEMYGEVLKILKSFPPDHEFKSAFLLRAIEYTYEQVSAKYDKLRTLIGLTGEKTNAT